MHDGRRVYELRKDSLFFMYFVAAYSSWAISPYIGKEEGVMYRSESLLTTEWFSFDGESSKWKPEAGMVSICAAEDPPEASTGAGVLGSVLPPHIRRVILDIGCNTRPMLHSTEEYNTRGEPVGTIAFEPIPSTAAEIQSLPNLFVVNAAVGNRDGLATMTWSQDDLANTASMFPPSAGLHSVWNTTQV
jgi:hypothetical protein